MSPVHFRIILKGFKFCITCLHEETLSTTTIQNVKRSLFKSVTEELCPAVSSKTSDIQNAMLTEASSSFLKKWQLFHLNNYTDSTSSLIPSWWPASQRATNGFYALVFTPWCSSLSQGIGWNSVTNGIPAEMTVWDLQSESLRDTGACLALRSPGLGEGSQGVTKTFKHPGESSTCWETAASCWELHWLASHGHEPSWKWFLQPQSSFQMM